MWEKETASVESKHREKDTKYKIMRWVALSWEDLALRPQVFLTQKEMPKALVKGNDETTQNHLLL